MDAANAGKPRYCRLCRQPLPAGAALPICETHVPEVARAALRRYRERLDLRHHEEPWLLFLLSGAPTAGASGWGLRADWLALNTMSGVIRRFMQTEEIAVWDTL